VAEINSALRDRFGDDFPGAPGTAGGTTTHGTKAGSAWPLLSPDIYAFYLPWHYFSQPLWGIYLIVEGVQSLGDEIHRVSLGNLSAREARRIAKIFLFHHEAYHNAAETFASRLEVSHRVPCYVAGFQPVWKTGFKGGMLHEEGLATAYAAEKVRSNAFEDVYPPSQMRTQKRLIAHAALVNIIGRMPSAYRSALHLLKPQQYRDGQNLFQEENRNNCFPPAPPKGALPPEVWDASPHAMRPSLQRNKSFSYVVRRSNPSIRLALQVPHFKRTDFIKQLDARLGGHEIGQGRGEHPKWRSNGGKTVSIPGHRELGRGLCRKILRQLGVNIGLTEFMSRSSTNTL
jgi:predicted RNA binding protein YcfA (HicA-like mRNA interferase family)